MVQHGPKIALAAFVIALFCVGCPKMTPAKIPSVCVKQFEKCKMPDGPLGVCQAIKCKKNETAPCLKCVSQH